MTRYIITDTQSGHKTLLVKTENREVRLHSAYDPVKEADRSVSGFNKGRATIIVVSGLGLGYHVRCLKEKYPDTFIVAVEHDPEVAALAAKIHPEFLQGIAVITTRGDIEKIFEAEDLAQFRGVAHYLHRPSFALHEDFYNAEFIEINRFFTSKISDLLTRFEFEQSWMSNILRNVHHTFTSGRVIDLFGRFRGYPGIIVSAGPSLRKNVDLLDSLYEKALIVCVDTAIKVLDRKRIRSHIVMTLDAQKHSLRHFLGLRGPLPMLLADLVSYPAITRSYAHEIIFSTTSKYYTDRQGKTRRETTPLVDWLENYIPPIGDIQSGGSVATSAFDLLLNLGCDPIILTGQDLAYTGREIHCSGTHHNDEWTGLYSRFVNLDTINQRVVRKRKIKRVESYGGGKVISDFVFDLYKGWFEDSSFKVPIQVINATEGGARIANTEEEPLSSLVKRLTVKKKTPEQILDEALNHRKCSDPTAFINAISGAMDSINGIQKKAESSLDNHKGGRSMEAADLIEQQGLVSLFNPFLKKSHIYIARHDLDPEKGKELILKDIQSACMRLLPLFRDCLKKMGTQ